MSCCIRPLHNGIVFQFEQDKTKHMGISQFKEETDWGFTYASTQDGMEYGRWVRVAAVGPDVPDDIQVGMRVCVDKLKWTNEFELDGVKYWKTDSDQILMIDTSEELQVN